MAYANCALCLANEKQHFHSINESAAHFNTACKNLMFSTEQNGGVAAGVSTIKHVNRFLRRLGQHCL